MNTHLKEFKEADDIIKKYKNRGESIRVSVPIEYNGDLYREIMFVLKSKGNKVAVGYLYIDDNNKVVDNKSTIRQLVKLGYYLNIFYNSESNLYIKRAMEGSDNIKNQKIEYHSICKALDKLKEENIDKTENVKQIIDSVIKLRIENDNKISELINLSEKHIEDGKFYGENIFNELYILYKKIMMMNFKRVNIINSGKNYYGNIDSNSRKHKGFLKSILVGKSKYMPFRKLEAIIRNYNKIITTYSKILGMDEEKYEKFLFNVEKDNIKLKMDVLRNKQETK